MDAGSPLRNDQGSVRARRRSGERAASSPHRQRVRTIMLASVGTPIDAKVIERTVEVAREKPTKVLVLSVARVWGTALGLPNPMLYPSKREWDEQRAIANEAARALEARGVRATTKLVGSRSASKAIARWAEFLGCRAIIIGAPAVGRWERWLRGDEPNRVSRRTRLPVHAVPLPTLPPRTSRDRRRPAS